jgi:hypothetical protein
MASFEPSALAIIVPSARRAVVIVSLFAEVNHP